MLECIVKVDCNACGASLTIGETTRFATCRECRSRLGIQRTDKAVYTEVLERLADGERSDASSDAPPPPRSGPIAVTTLVPAGGSESLLRLGVGVVVVASDLYWWFTDPSMQSLSARVLLLAAGAWLILSGVWKLIANARARRAADSQTQAVMDRLSRMPPPPGG